MYDIYTSMLSSLMCNMLNYLFTTSYVSAIFEIIDSPVQLVNVANRKSWSDAVVPITMIAYGVAGLRDANLSLPCWRGAHKDGRPASCAFDSRLAVQSPQERLPGVFGKLYHWMGRSSTKCESAVDATRLTT